MNDSIELSEERIELEASHEVEEVKKHIGVYSLMKNILRVDYLSWNVEFEYFVSWGSNGDGSSTTDRIDYSRMEEFDEYNKPFFREIIRVSQFDHSSKEHTVLAHTQKIYYTKREAELISPWICYGDVDEEGGAEAIINADSEHFEVIKIIVKAINTEGTTKHSKALLSIARETDIV